MIDAPWRDEEKQESYECPECGKDAVRWVQSDIRLKDGTFIPALERMQCSACGENLFDLQAMKRISDARGKKSSAGRSLKAALGDRFKRMPD